MALRPAPKTWDEYRSGVLGWLNEQWGPERRCAYCANPGWDIGPVVFLRKQPLWPDMGGGPNLVFPQAQVICTKCGHTVLINVLYIFEPQQQLRLQPQVALPQSPMQ